MPGGLVGVGRVSLALGFVRGLNWLCQRIESVLSEGWVPFWVCARIVELVPGLLGGVYSVM